MGGGGEGGGGGGTILKGPGQREHSSTKCAYLIPGIHCVFAQASESKVSEKGDCAVTFHSL